MRAVIITEYGDADVLKVEHRESPEPGATDVQIAVGAAGVNFADVMSRLGQYPHSLPAPCIGGYEVAGTVTAVGADVRRIDVGDRVAAATRTGGYAETVSIAEDDVLVLPDGMSLAEGAAVPIAYATAFAALVTYGGLRAGERVLVHAAAGGVGIAATQIAKKIGAHVTGTASPAKHGAIRELGVDEAIDYTVPGWEDGLEGFDLVIDAIGGDSFRRSYEMLRVGGRLVPFGAVSVFGEAARNRPPTEDEGDFRLVGGLDTLTLMVDSKAVLGLDLRVLWDDRGSLRQWLEPLEPLLTDRTIRPVVSDLVPFDEAPAAHRLLSERRNIGKVVLVP